MLCKSVELSLGLRSLLLTACYVSYVCIVCLHVISNLNGLSKNFHSEMWYITRKTSKCTRALFEKVIGRQEKGLSDSIP